MCYYVGTPVCACMVSFVCQHYDSDGGSSSWGVSDQEGHSRTTSLGREATQDDSSKISCSPQGMQEQTRKSTITSLLALTWISPVPNRSSLLALTWVSSIPIVSIGLDPSGFFLQASLRTDLWPSCGDDDCGTNTSVCGPQAVAIT